MNQIFNKKISKYYNKNQAEQYEGRRNNPTWLAEIEIFHKIKKKIATKYNRKIKILDVPAGTGRWITEIQDIASNYLGVDVSKNMLDQAELKLKDCSNEFKKNVKLINSSVAELPLHYSGSFDLIISTRFLPHFSIHEIKNIMNILRSYSKEDLLIMVRVTDRKISILFEIFELVLKSPFGAIKRYLKTGRLSYTKLDSAYENIFRETGFNVIKKNLVSEDKYSKFEYWELTIKNTNKISKDI